MDVRVNDRVVRILQRQGEGFRVQGSIMRRDEDGNLYDLTWMLMEELKDFPNATYKDLGDAVSRIYDIDMIPAPRKEVSQVAELNAGLEA